MISITASSGKFNIRLCLVFLKTVKSFWKFKNFNDIMEGSLLFKWYHDQKITSFFSSDFERVFAAKIFSFDFYPKAVNFVFKFGFHGPPLLTFKTDRPQREK